MNYQKTYMNHIHSSSLLCQLATMWKSQTLCDAVIRSGSNITRAHRVVLVAACPMLQSMESAASGSHLEVRVASDIKVDSIHTFLQYLYEGFMTLTEENCKDVEKIARLLQVEGVVKCCADFNKCMNTSSSGQYKYSLMDQVEFRHVRTTELSKCQDKAAKRSADGGRVSPGSKRQRVLRPSSPSDHSMSHRAHDMHGMSESYMPDANDPWERVPRVGRPQPGVIDIVEDSLELIQTEPPGKHSTDSRRVQQSVGISVASQHNKEANLQVVNIAGSSEQTLTTPASRTVSDSLLIPDSPSSSSSSSFKESSGVSRPTDRGPQVQPPPQLQRMDPNRQQSHGIDQSRQQQGMDPNRQPTHGTINLIDIPQSPEHDASKQSSSRQLPRSSEALPSPHKPFPVSLTAVPRATQSFQSKPYAAGSATQAESSSPRGQKAPGRSDSERSSPADRPQDSGLKGKSDIPESGPDISIIKVEHGSNSMVSDSTGGLDMYVSGGGVSLSANQSAGQGEEEEHSDYELEEPPGDMSREGEMSMEGGDQSANWFMGNAKDVVKTEPISAEPTEIIVVKKEQNEEIVTVPWHDNQPEMPGRQTDLDFMRRQRGLESRTFGQLGQSSGHLDQGQTWHAQERHTEDMETTPVTTTASEHDEEAASQENQPEDQARNSRPRRYPPKEHPEKRVSLHSCHECYEVFEDSTELRLHMNNIHNMDTTYVIVCEICDKKFKTTNGYVIHKDRYHNNTEKYPKCPKCGKNFASASSLETHMITHTKQKAFTCLTCNKSFKFKGTLKSHKCE